MDNLEGASAGRQRLAQHPEIVRQGHITPPNELVIGLRQPVRAVTRNEHRRRPRREHIAQLETWGDMKALDIKAVQKGPRIHDGASRHHPNGVINGVLHRIGQILREAHQPFLPRVRPLQVPERGHGKGREVGENRDGRNYRSQRGPISDFFP